MRDDRQNRVRFTTLAMLTAISCGLVFVNFPFPLFPAFKYELADVPILIAGYGSPRRYHHRRDVTRRRIRRARNQYERLYEGS